MSSLNRIRANQQNARFSTGPTSPEGKAAVRGNALKSGVYAVAETALPFEKPGDLETLKAEYQDRFAPDTPEQRCLVDDLVRDEWLLRRFAAVEAQLFTDGWEGRSRQHHSVFTVGHAYLRVDQTLGRLQRRITSTRKSYLETLTALRKLQAEAQGEPAPAKRPPNPAVAATQLPRTKPLASEPDSQYPGEPPSSAVRPAGIGFVPQGSVSRSAAPQSGASYGSRRALLS